MDARRFRKDSTRRLAEFRWWGSVLLAMFALVQAARDPFGGAGPNAIRIASAAMNDVNAGDLSIQTP